MRRKTLNEIEKKNAEIILSRLDKYPKIVLMSYILNNADTYSLEANKEMFDDLDYFNKDYQKKKSE